jgi:hypothetical protein
MNDILSGKIYSDMIIAQYAFYINLIEFTNKAISDFYNMR